MLLDEIQAITVCIGYADFLKETVIWNRSLFDRWLIVTEPDDEATREICRQYKLQCLVTSDKDRDGEFSKGRLVERGLQHVSASTWVCHIDADIVLPRSFRHDLELANLNGECIHGADRIMLDGWEQWQKFKATGWLDKTSGEYSNSVVVPKGYHVGARWVGKQDGYVPIGYFQFWHREDGEEEWRGVRVKGYPHFHGKSCRTDTQHGLQWDRRQRVLIPELYVVHLGSDGAHNGINWKGRKSKPFGPSDTPTSSECHLS